jgi:cytochrome c-type biogenesis protein CcmH
VFSKRLFSLVAGFILVSASWMAGASTPTVKSVGEAVICQCGCTQTVTACNHFECSTRAEMNAISDKEIKAGKDETTILQDFVKRYGVQVLASPPATGFTLTIWILPGIGLMAGLLLVVVIVRRWRKPSPESNLPPPDPIDPKILEAMEEEMKKVAG